MDDSPVLVESEQVDKVRRDRGRGRASDDRVVGMERHDFPHAVGMSPKPGKLAIGVDMEDVADVAHPGAEVVLVGRRGTNGDVLTAAGCHGGGSLQSLFEAAGLSNVVAQTITATVRLESVDEHLRFLNDAFGALHMLMKNRFVSPAELVVCAGTAG